jgi:hypothetical protein
MSAALDRTAHTVDLSRDTVRSLNAALHDLPTDTNATLWRVLNPRGQHAVAVGLTR